MPTGLSDILLNVFPLLTGATGFIGATGTRGVNPIGLSVSGGIYSKKQTILRSGTAATFTRDANCTFAQIIVVGGGGGGGGAGSDAASGSCAGGGGAGGAAIAWYTAAELGSTAIYTIGTGGLGSIIATNGANGNASTFTPAGTGAALTGNGGTGGTGSNITGVQQSVAGGAGGTATGGQINITGGAGGPSASNISIAHSGFGGDSIFSGGAPGKSINAAGTANGDIGSDNSGSGGSGAINLNSEPISFDGGNGANGIIIIIEFLT